jgi:hypothetical protein
MTTFRGAVAIDGKPVESGTIHFKFRGGASDSAGGASINAGAFEVATKRGLLPGEYDATLLAFRKTGRTLDDPQRGKVSETTAIALVNSPQRVQISAQNANSLQLDFSEAKD